METSKTDTAYISREGAIQVKDIYQTFDYSHAKHWFVDCKSKYFDAQHVRVHGPGDEKRHEVRLIATGQTIYTDDTFTVPTIIVLDLPEYIDWHVVIEPDKDEIHIVAFRTDYFE